MAADRRGRPTAGQSGGHSRQRWRCATGPTRRDRDVAVVVGINGPELLILPTRRLRASTPGGRAVWALFPPARRLRAAIPCFSPPWAATHPPDGDRCVSRDEAQDLGLVNFSVEGKERWRLPLGPFNTLYGLASSSVLVLRRSRRPSPFPATASAWFGARPTIRTQTWCWLRISVPAPQ
jgi:hypothetical protein